MKPALIINSHSSNLECLNIYFFCLEKHIDLNLFENIYLFFDKNLQNAPSFLKVIVYNEKDCFRDQMIFCLQQVKEKILLYSNEDYLFYEKPKIEKIHKILNKLENSNFSFIKFVHTNIDSNIEIEKNFYLIDKTCENNFSQALSFWKTSDLLNIHIKCPVSEIGKKGDTSSHLEIEAKTICKQLNISGLCYYNNEPQRGFFHYDSEIFPHVASALNRGEWNTKEYPEINKIKIEFFNSLK